MIPSRIYSGLEDSSELELNAMNNAGIFSDVDQLHALKSCLLTLDGGMNRVVVNLVANSETLRGGPERGGWEALVDSISLFRL